MLESQPPVPQNVTVFAGRTFRGDQVNVRSVKWALVQYDRCPCAKRFGHRQECTQRTDLVRAEGEDSHVQAKERGLRGNQPG